MSNKGLAVVLQLELHCLARAFRPQMTLKGVRNIRANMLHSRFLR